MSLQHVNAKVAEFEKQFPENTIVINSPVNFVVQDATTITFQTNTKYVFGATITTAKRFIVEANVIIEGTVDIVLFYTGTDAMFTSADAGTFKITAIRTRCPSATQTFDFSASSPGAGFFILNQVTVDDTPKFGTFDNTGFILLDEVVSSGIEDGMSLVGTIDQFIIRTFTIVADGTSLIGIDLGSATISLTLTFTDFAVLGAAGTVGISGLTGSGNISTFLIAGVQNSRFIPPVTPLVGISESDLRWEFEDCPPVPDSTKTVDSFLSASQTVTITTAGVFVAIAGTNWLSDVTERFTTTTAGLMTYDSSISTKSQVAITATVEKVGGGTDLIEIAVAFNGTESDKTMAGTKNKDPTSLTSIGIFTTVATDTFQAFVANIDSTANIIVSRSTANVINGF